MGGPSALPALPNLALGALIGEGGMGEVYAAEHVQHGSVVVKLMHAHLDERNRERLRLEAETLSRVQSRYVVRLLDWGIAGSRPYLVMERLQGHGLDARLCNGPLPLEEAVDIALDVLRGLAAVHANKLVHRDIKPANIFICPDRAVLLDFGIVKMVEKLTGVNPLSNPTKAGAAIGTPRYMSPEQARGTTVSTRTDLYGVGAVLFRMLTGENLYPYDTFVKQVTAHVKEPPRRPSEVRGGGILPPAIDEVVLHALAKKQDDRIPSAEAFIAALEAAAPRAALPILHDLDSSSETVVLRQDDHAAPTAPEAPHALAPAPRAQVPAPARDEATPLRPGDVCGGYTIEEEIGRGGMGVVFRAVSPSGARRAIKTLVFGGHLSEQLAERFSREMLMLSSIESPHMVRFFDAGKIERPEGTTMWIALEYLEGRTLRQIITETPQGIEPETVARWGRHIAEGVLAAHKLFVVHRDLKPENAALSGETVKVFDLGIAKWQLASNSTAGNLRIGTLAYMAPEQANPSMGKVDERTDIYALGLILHELATGRHPICPFDEPISATEVQLRIVGMVPPPLDQIIPGFPTDLAAVVVRCLHKYPDQRFASMRELIDALDDALTRLRTARHAPAFAALGVDAAAAHAAVRKARTSSGTDATPPPVVTDRAASSSSGGAPSQRRGSGGFQTGQPFTHRLTPGESQIQAWKAEADALRAAKQGQATSPAGTVKMAEVSESAIVAQVAAATAAAGGYVQGASPPGSVGAGYPPSPGPAPLGNANLLSTQMADPQQLARAHGHVDSTAMPPTEALPYAGSQVGHSAPPAPSKSRGLVVGLVAALTVVGVLAGAVVLGRATLFASPDPGSSPEADAPTTAPAEGATPSEAPDAQPTASDAPAASNAAPAIDPSAIAPTIPSASASVDPSAAPAPPPPPPLPPPGDPPPPPPHAHQTQHPLDRPMSDARKSAVAAADPRARANGASTSPSVDAVSTDLVLDAALLDGGEALADAESSTEPVEGPRLNPEVLERMALELRDAGDPDLKGGLTHRRAAEPSRRAALSAAIPEQVAVELPVQKVVIRGAASVGPAPTTGDVEPRGELALSDDVDAPPIVRSAVHAPTPNDHALAAAHSAKRLAPCDATQVPGVAQSERTRTRAKAGVGAGAAALAGVGLLAFVAVRGGWLKEDTGASATATETSLTGTADAPASGSPITTPSAAPSSMDAALETTPPTTTPAAPAVSPHEPSAPALPLSNSKPRSLPTATEPASRPASPRRPTSSPPPAPPASPAPARPTPTPDSAPPTPSSIRIF